MKSIEITGQLRTDLGKKGSKLLRREERVPCVMYGGSENIHFSVEKREILKLVNTHNVYIINFNIDGKEVKAIIQDVQYHPVSDEPLHFDFLQVTEEAPVTIGVPVILEGFAVGVQAGGKLQLMQRRLKVKAFIKDLPESLTVNVTDLGLGKVIKVGELEFENLELLSPASSVVASVKLTRAARGAMAAAATEA